eukprot:2429659-Rhodomonas_salina.3
MARSSPCAMVLHGCCNILRATCTVSVRSRPCLDRPNFCDIVLGDGFQNAQEMRESKRDRERVAPAKKPSGLRHRESFQMTFARCRWLPRTCETYPPPCTCGPVPRNPLLVSTFLAKRTTPDEPV